MSFKVGDKVVCIRQKKLDGDCNNYAEDYLTIGETYTVKTADVEYEDTGEFAIRLDEDMYLHAVSNFKLAAPLIKINLV